MDGTEYDEFVRGDRRSYTEEVEPWGSVDVQAEEEIVRCYANAGGWQWEAEGPDRTTAARRLYDRLRELNPFAGSDWGPPGSWGMGPLSEAIPAVTRKRMIAYQRALDPNMVDDD